MNRILCFFTLLTLLTVGCKKDDFPDEFSVYGKWKEFIPDSAKTEIEFRRYNDMLLKLRNEPVSSLKKYLLERENELEIFDPSDFPNGISSKHKITYDSKNGQITIYGLYPSTGDNSSTVFIRN